MIFLFLEEEVDSRYLSLLDLLGGDWVVVYLCGGCCLTIHVFHITELKIYVIVVNVEVTSNPYLTSELKFCCSVAEVRICRIVRAGDGIFA